MREQMNDHAKSDPIEVRIAKTDIWETEVNIFRLKKNPPYHRWSHPSKPIVLPIDIYLVDGDTPPFCSPSFKWVAYPNDVYTG